jgi:hypothetical protein
MCSYIWVIDLTFMSSILNRFNALEVYKLSNSDWLCKALNHMWGTFKLWMSVYVMLRCVVCSLNFFSVLLLQFQFCLWCFCLAVYDRICLFSFTICLIVVACLNPWPSSLWTICFILIHIILKLLISFLFVTLSKTSLFGLLMDLHLLEFKPLVWFFCWLFSRDYVINGA